MVTPLAGYRVIDLGTMITAPLAAMMLGDLGAEVIKIEREDGDPFRAFNGSRYSPHFAAFNRNKSSVVLDLRSETGKKSLFDLIVKADVVIDNFRPGVLERLGIADMMRLNEKLVHCSITGFGNRGPYSKRPAYDTVGQALSGIAALSIHPDNPKLSGTTISDNITGMYACYGIMAALLERKTTGRGRRVEVNMLEASIAFMPDAFLNYEMLNLRNDAYTRVSLSQAYVFRCADRKLIAIHLSSAEKFWKGLLSALESPQLGCDTRFSKRTDRIENYIELMAELQSCFGGKPRAYWICRLDEYDVPFAQIHQTDEVMADPQVDALQSFRALILPNGKSVRSIQVPLLFDGERMSTWKAAPEFPDQGKLKTVQSQDAEDCARNETGTGRF